MGFRVISVDGMLIREARSYVLKCYACFRYIEYYDILYKLVISSNNNNSYSEDTRIVNT